MATGVFSLKKVYKRKYQNVKEKNFAYWPEGGIYGITVGGNVGESNAFRLDFSNETYTTFTFGPAPGLQGVRGASGVSNNKFGYIAGGTPTPPGFNGGSPSIRAFDFYTLTPSPGGSLFLDDYEGQGAVSSGYCAYFGGGYAYSPNTFCTTVERFDYSSTEVRIIPATLSTARFYIAGIQSPSYGYYAGGESTTIDPINAQPGARFSNIDRLDFSTDSTTTPFATLPTSKSQMCSVLSQSFGYFAGGTTPSAGLSTIDRFDFYTETRRNFPSTLPSPVRVGASPNYSNLYGYFIGGSALSSVNRLDFITETIASIPNTPIAKTLAAGTSGTSVGKGG